METIIKVELVPDHRADLVKKTKKFIYYWYNLTTRIDPALVDIYIKHPGRNIKTGYQTNFDSFVDSIFRKFPPRYIERQTVEKECLSYLDNIVIQGIEFEESIEDEITSLLRKLENLIGEWHVVVPIDNLNFKDLDDFKIGKVNLYSFKKFDELLNSSIKNIAWGGMKENIFIDKEKKIWADVALIIEDGKQYREVLPEIESTINILRICLYLLNPSFFNRAKIGVSEGFLSRRIMISYNKDTNSLGANCENIRFNLPFILAKKDLEQLYQQYPLSDINSILCKDELSRSDIERRLLIALGWISAGIHEDLFRDKFLDYAIALECMLGKKEESVPIAESLAERCAFLLENDDPDDRYNIYKNVKFLYGERSKIVHEGKSDIDEEHVKVFESYALDCLFRIVGLLKELNLKNMRDLVDWLTKKKMRLYYNRSIL